MSDDSQHETPKWVWSPAAATAGATGEPAGDPSADQAPTSDGPAPDAPTGLLGGGIRSDAVPPRSVTAGPSAASGPTPASPPSQPTPYEPTPYEPTPNPYQFQQNQYQQNQYQQNPYQPPGSAPAPAPHEQPAASPRPEALLLPGRSPVQSTVADAGWQGRVRRLSGGLVKPQPSSAEMATRRARQDIQRTFSRPMTVVVIQPKGGAGKTPTTIGLASALGAHRGGYVVGWDDNETRGTLAVRVSNANEQRTTVWDLLRDLPKFERADARVGDLSHYVRSQGAAQFDALVSDDSPGNMAQIGEDEFRRIHSVLQRFYREIIIDTGNNVRSPNWQAAVNAADLIVVVSTYQRDVGYSGSWVLDHLAETGREHLVTSAVTVLTAADPTPDPTVRRQLLEHFTARTGSVIEIPYDPVIAVGGPMEWIQLKPTTREAWIRAGAAVVDALAAGDERARQASRQN